MNERNIQSGDAAENFAVDAWGAQEREKALQKEIAAVQERSAELSKELETRDAQIAELLGLSEAQAEWARNLAVQFVGQDAAVREILASTSWQITRPMRKMGKAVPRLANLGRRSLNLISWIARGQFWRIREVVRPSEDRNTSLQVESVQPPPPGARGEMPGDIVLYTGYYTAATAQRQKEIDFCLEQNIACKAIARIVLLVEPGRDPPLSDPKILVVPVAGRPTYQQWIDLSQELPASTVSLLANSDIYFDDTVAELREVFRHDKNFVALSRHERICSRLSRHWRPVWSQDVWAFKAGTDIAAALRLALDIPMGVPRCDNKIAYLFAVHGWQIVNPVERVVAAHVHESRVRTYNKFRDATVLGGVAYVHPSHPYSAPAKLDYDIWGLNRERGLPVPVGYSGSVSLSYAAIQQTIAHAPAHVTIRQTGVVPTGDQSVRLEHSSGVPVVLDTSPIRISARPAHAGDDHFWQYPCLTEGEAFERHLKMAAGSNIDPERRVIHTYLGLPWATYVDRRTEVRGLAEIIRARVEAARAHSPGFELAVHTVCQHYAWWRIADIYADLGITDLHLSHCTRKAAAYFSSLNIRVHSWSLYAVNVEDATRAVGLKILKPKSEKRYLASFIGSHMQHYSSDVRLRLSEAARRDGGSDLLFELTDQWHFNQVVYDEQVKRRNLKRRQVDRHLEASRRYNEVLSNSIFSLCPEGAGPNSLRLWESLAVGSIPVAIFDDWIPPSGGDSAPCFEDACVVLRTTEIDDLFDRLRRMESAEIETRSQACIDYYGAIRAKLTFEPQPSPKSGQSHERNVFAVDPG